MRGVVAIVVCVVAAAVGPAAARAYDSRHIFVTNRGGNDIVELTDDLVLVRTWFDTEGLSVPNGMAFTPTGELWVADTGNNRIVAFDTPGARTLTIDTATALGGSVESIYFDSMGTLYASANPGVGRVARFARDGTPGADVVFDPAFLNLGNVNLTAAGHVVVSDFSGAHRGLRELDRATGAVLATFGTELGRQEDVMIDGADRVFVSHFDNDEIVVFGADRALERSFTAPGLVRPTGIVLTHDCRVIVAGFDSNALFEFRHDGTFLRRVDVAGVTLPESLAIAGQGLPGSFDEFAERVPTCDPMPDGGVPDAGGATGDAGAPRDAGAATDAGAVSGDDAGPARHAAAAAGCCSIAPGASRGAHGALCIAAMAVALAARASCHRRARARR